MGFEDCKITQADIAAHGIQGKPNKLPGPTAANKLAFDELVTEIVAERLNALIDALQSAAAAAELGVDTLPGGVEADSVQEALAAVIEGMQDMSQGSVGPGGIATDNLAAGCVTTAKIAALAVTTALLAAGCVTTEKVADQNITTAKIALLAITTALLADGAVTADKLGNLSVTAAKIANAAVETTKLAAGAVTTVKLADGAVTTAKIAALAITTALLADGAVTAAKLDPALTYAAVNLSAEQVVPIYIGTDTPTAATLPEGAVYIRYAAPEE